MKIGEVGFTQLDKFMEVLQLAPFDPDQKGNIVQ